jgi:hypothetical protein
VVALHLTCAIVYLLLGSLRLQAAFGEAGPLPPVKRALGALIRWLDEDNGSTPLAFAYFLFIIYHMGTYTP